MSVYLITVTAVDGELVEWPHAVGTLDDARQCADLLVGAGREMTGDPRVEIADPRWDRHCLAAQLLGEAGGTIGPLPDGATITVTRASWDDLVGPGGWDANTTEAEVVAAFNAR